MSSGDRCKIMTSFRTDPDKPIISKILFCFRCCLDSYNTEPSVPDITAIHPLAGGDPLVGGGGGEAHVSQ